MSQADQGRGCAGSPHGELLFGKLYAIGIGLLRRLA
jgi:hypothetical protein